MEDLLSQDAVSVAKHILGWNVVKTEGNKQLVGKIVEAEAYDQKDAASHSYRGMTPRTEVMFGSPGHAYVYFTYGIHYCFNIVTGPRGYGSAVLIRALEPLEGIEAMRPRRNNLPDVQLTSGPAKLCQALAIKRELNGHSLGKKPLQLEPGKAINPEDIITTTRIGISKDSHRPWRFYIKDNPFVSKP